MKGFSVEPGSKGVWIAESDAVSPSRTETRARISPVIGSVTSTSPPRAPVFSMASSSASCAISCRSMSSVRTTSLPDMGGLTVKRSPGIGTPR